MPNTVHIDRELQLTYPTARKVIRVRNSSGGALAKGDVVVWDTAVARGDSVTTTTTGDDPKVAGVVLESIANGSMGKIQVEGFFSDLKANGTTDIAAGDALSSFTTAKIAQKATSGKAGVFALALEAYTTNDSNGLIDCILIPAGRQDASATVTYGTAGQMAADGVAAANAAGSTNAVSRVDHAHTLTADTPALVLGTTNAAGTAGLVLSSDATILVFDATAPTTIQPDASAAAGSATVAARRDHTHAIAAAAPSDGSLAASNAEGTGNDFARSTHNHRAVVLDDIDFEVGTGYDATFGWKTGDADNHALVIGTGASEALHIAQKADTGTDWNVAAFSHPTLVVHSATTPATDYMRFYHDATDAFWDSVSVTNVKLQIGGTTEANFAANAVTFEKAASTSNETLTISNTTNSGASHAIVDVKVGGTTSTGDPQLRFSIPSGSPAGWYVGVDNSANDTLLVGTGTAVGTTTFLSLDGRTTTADITVFALTPQAITASFTAAQLIRANNLAASTTITNSNTAQLTALWEWTRVGQLTVAQSGGAFTIDKAAGLVVAGPKPAASVTMTDSAAIRILDVGAVAGTLTTQAGVWIESLSNGGTNDYGYYVAGAGTYQVFADGTDASRFDGPVEHAVGLVGTPSITWVGDTNTGFYSSAAEVMDVSITGARTLTFRAGGLSLGANARAFSTAGTNNLVIEVGTAPSGSVTDAAGLYAADATAVLYKINEAGTATVVG